jgi:hypothetical protein
MPETNQWEYRVKTYGSFFKGVKDDELETELNQWGEEGWEVVAYRLVENTNQAQLIARRPLTRESRRWRSMP